MIESVDTLKVVEAVRVLPIPYSLKSDDVIAGILLFCFILSAYILARSKKFLWQQGKSYFLHKERISLFVSSTATDMRYLLLLILQTCLLLGLFFLCYFTDNTPELTDHVSHHLLLAIYTGICLLYLAVKWVVYSFLGWTFFDKNYTNLWLESYSTLIYYLGFFLFPFILLIIYFEVSIAVLVTIGLSVLIFTKLLMFYKWLKFFFNNINGVFLLILYFCALEIIPCFILFKGMIFINSMLLIKF